MTGHFSSPTPLFFPKIKISLCIPELSEGQVSLSIIWILLLQLPDFRFMGILLFQIPDLRFTGILLFQIPSRWNYRHEPGLPVIFEIQGLGLILHTGKVRTESETVESFVALPRGL